MSLQNREKQAGWIEVHFRKDKLPNITGYKEVLQEDYTCLGAPMSMLEVDTINDVTDMYYFNWQDVGAPRQIRRLDIIAVKPKGHPTCGYLVLDPKRDLGLIDHPDVPFGVCRKYYGDDTNPLRLWIIPRPWNLFAKAKAKG